MSDLLAFSLLILSTAVLILSYAVKNLAQLSWEEMARGLVATGALLAGLALFTKYSEVDKMGLSNGAGIVLLAETEGPMPVSSIRLWVYSAMVQCANICRYHGKRLLLHPVWMFRKLLW